IPLSAAIDLNTGFGNIGVFSGFGRLVLHNGTKVFVIFLPSGEVEDLGVVTVAQHAYSENWAYWGVAEYFNDATWMVYVRDPQTIVRTRVPDGLTIPVGTFGNLSDMASVTVSPVLNRRYFHHQGGSQVRTGHEAR